MDENKKILFIINKYSGTGYRPEVEGKILSYCDQFNIECTIEFTQGRGHATELAKEGVMKKFDRVFAVGGDGTVNEVAQGLIGSGVTMGILPKGSGNGLARHLGIPMSFKGALRLINSTKTILMDTFLVNNKVSVNISGIGFDGHIAGLFGKNGKRGLVGYGKLVLKEFLRYKEFAVDVQMDGHHLHKDSFIVALANSSQFGNNAQVAPHASVCDEMIDVCFIKKVPIPQAAGFAQKMFSGRLNKSSFVEITKAKDISLDFDRAMPYHIDGEALAPSRHFKIEVKPASLKMVVPEKQRVKRKYPI